VDLFLPPVGAAALTLASAGANVQLHFNSNAEDAERRETAAA
jgi:hypothetical protein